MLLTIDTCAKLCAASVSEGGAERGRSVRDIGTGHAEQLMDVIAEALVAAGSEHADISGVAVSVGPGSFTGIRVGVSAARGLALALGVPSTGVGTIEAIALETRERFPERPVLVAIDARREELYVALFEADGRMVHPPSVATLADAAGMAASLAAPVIAGSAAAMVAEAAGGPFEIASRAATADISAYARLAHRQGFNDERPKPLYLRAPDAKPQASFVLPYRTDLA